MLVNYMQNPEATTFAALVEGDCFMQENDSNLYLKIASAFQSPNTVRLCDGVGLKTSLGEQVRACRDAMVTRNTK